MRPPSCPPLAEVSPISGVGSGSLPAGHRKGRSEGDAVPDLENPAPPFKYTWCILFFWDYFSSVNNKYFSLKQTNKHTHTKKTVPQTVSPSICRWLPSCVYHEASTPNKGSLCGSGGGRFLRTRLAPGLCLPALGFLSRR